MGLSCPYDGVCTLMTDNIDNIHRNTCAQHYKCSIIKFCITLRLLPAIRFCSNLLLFHSASIKDLAHER